MGCQRLFGMGIDHVFVFDIQRPGECTMMFNTLMALTDNRKRLVILSLLTFAALC